MRPLAAKSGATASDCRPRSSTQQSTVERRSTSVLARPSITCLIQPERSATINRSGSAGGEVTYIGSVKLPTDRSEAPCAPAAPSSARARQQRAIEAAIRCGCMAVQLRGRPPSPCPDRRPANVRFRRGREPGSGTMGSMTTSTSQPAAGVRTLDNYIGGSWVPSSGSELLDVIDPASGETIARAPVSTAADLDAAVEAARAALPEWRNVSVIERGRRLFRLRDALDRRREDLARSVTA